MPGLNISHDTLDDLPESINPRDLYTERDGKFILTGVSGLKTQADVDAIKGFLKTERDEHKATKLKYRDFHDVDVEKYNADMLRLAELEVLTKGTQEEFDAKLEGLTEARVRSRLSPLERDAKKSTEAMATMSEELDTLRAEKSGRVILDNLRLTAADAKLPAESMPDAELLAQNIFTLDETTGRPITKVNQLGFTDGVEADVFMQELREKRAHWWPESRGGNATGSRGGSAFPNNPFSGAHWNVTEQGRVFKEQGRDKAEQMAKAGGTTFGGPRPEKK